MTIDELLAEAKAAMHDLRTGKSVRVLVDQNGERIEYTAANRPDLAKYIQELEAKKAGRSLGADGPMGFYM